jgi:hypothetical protein
VDLIHPIRAEDWYPHGRGEDPMFRWQRVKALSFLANLLNLNRLHPKPLKKTPHILWFFLLDIKFRFFVYLTQSKASSNHSTGAGPKIQSHHELLRAYLPERDPETLISFPY